MNVYLFKNEDPHSTDFELAGDDGSIASFYHNGGGMIVDYYRIRIDPEWEPDELWTNLGEGKSNWEEYPNEHKLTKTMLKKALEYMYVNREEANIKVVNYVGNSPQAILNLFKALKIHNHYDKTKTDCVRH